MNLHPWSYVKLLVGFFFNLFIYLINLFFVLQIVIKIFSILLINKIKIVALSVGQ
jgi:hypothetical protein